MVSSHAATAAPRRIAARGRNARGRWPSPRAGGGNDTEEDQREGVPMRSLRQAEVEGRFEAEGWRVRKDRAPVKSSYAHMK
jgi:hypothetical protein